MELEQEYIPGGGWHAAAVNYNLSTLKIGVQMEMPLHSVSARNLSVLISGHSRQRTESSEPVMFQGPAIVSSRTYI